MQCIWVRILIIAFIATRQKQPNRHGPKGFIRVLLLKSVAWERMRITAIPNDADFPPNANCMFLSRESRQKCWGNKPVPLAYPTKWPYFPAIPLLGIFPHRTESRDSNLLEQRNLGRQHAHSRKVKAAQCPPKDKWVKQMGHGDTMR